ncbi:hypothetical protein ABZ371_06920 [Streptomyces sp. NPDC005899]|uniref:hypothetical protein n=1 Tax=Streptomyces sp. NPDC005899 TaxID=3155716 RepID=UPI0033E268B4
MCGNCDQRYEIDWEQAWPGVKVECQEQDQAMSGQKGNERKGTGWFARLRG